MMLEKVDEIVRGLEGDVIDKYLGAFACIAANIGEWNEIQIIL